MAPVRRNSYTHEFKLMVISSAERVGNREAARQHGCSEKGVRDWRRMETSIRAAPRRHRAVSIDELYFVLHSDRHKKGQDLITAHCWKHVFLWPLVAALDN